MAICNWLARALARSQLDTATAGGTWVAGDTVTATINGKSITFTATTTTAAHMITGLLALLQASTVAEFDEIAWTSPTATTIAGTSVAGVSFTLTVSRVTAGTGTFTTATTTTATGPNHWNDANNWDVAAVPVNTDTVNADLARGSILYGMDQSAVTLTSLRIFRSAQTQNRLGLPLLNALGYTEYRDTALKIGATTAIFDADCPYSVNFGAVQVNAEIRAAAPSATGEPSAVLVGSNAANVWEFVGGSAALGLFPGAGAGGATLRVGKNASLICGPDTAPVDVTNAGQLEFFGTFNTFTNEDGQASLYGTLAASTLDINGGTVYKRFSGTIAAVEVGPGILDCSNDLSPATFTELTLEVGGQVIDPGETLTISNGVTLGFGVNSYQAA